MQIDGPFNVPSQPINGFIVFKPVFATDGKSQTGSY